MDSVEVSVRDEKVSRGLCLPVAAACAGLGVGLCAVKRNAGRKEVLKNPTETNTAI